MNETSARWSTAVVAAGVLAVGGPTAAAAGGLSEGRAAALDRFIGQFVELAMFDGTVLVDVGGEVVYERSFGLASYEHGVTHDARTRFRIASVSKSLTDAAFARLVQAGELTMETPLALYLPEFPSAEAIRIGQLLDYTSGIPHTNDQPWGDGKTSLTVDEIVERLAAMPLDFEPGSDSNYSNGGYAVAAKVLELVVGAPYGEAMRRLVFDPLGMADTAHIEDARAPIRHMATGYEPGAFPGERRHSRFYAVETRPGGGSLHSTAGDLLRFARAVFRQGFVRPELARSVLGADDGGFLGQGRSPGFVTKLYWGRERDVIVVSLANSYAVPAGWGRAIAGLATGEPATAGWPDLRLAAPTVRPDDPRLGRYRASFGNRETVIGRSARGAMIIEDADSESTTGLVPLADGAFLQPLYFQRCAQDGETRVVTCRILSGDERYTSVLTPEPHG